MNRSRSSYMVLAGVAALIGAFPLATGCDAMNGESPGASFSVPRTAMTGGIPDPPPNGLNGDDPTWLWAGDTLDALELLGNGALEQENQKLPSLPNLPADSRKIIESAIKCALDQFDAVQDTDTDERYAGWWGLAPDWTSRSLTLQERRWVSACMLQKLNPSSNPVPILLEGDLGPIEIHPFWRERYDFPESMTFGDLFAGRGHVEAFVCNLGDDPASACGDPAAFMMTRICDTNPSCGITILGNCSDAGHEENGYWTFPAFGYHEAVAARLKTRDASCQEP